MATVEQALSRLQRSAFRAKFHLSEQDRQYIADKGMETIQRHAADVEQGIAIQTFNTTNEMFENLFPGKK